MQERGSFWLNSFWSCGAKQSRGWGSGHMKFWLSIVSFTPSRQRALKKPHPWLPLSRAWLVKLKHPSVCGWTHGQMMVTDGAPVGCLAPPHCLHFPWAEREREIDAQASLEYSS